MVGYWCGKLFHCNVYLITYAPLLSRNLVRNTYNSCRSTNLIEILLQEERNSRDDCGNYVRAGASGCASCAKSELLAEVEVTSVIDVVCVLAENLLVGVLRGRCKWMVSVRTSVVEVVGVGVGDVILARVLTLLGALRYGSSVTAACIRIRCR